MSAPTRVLPTHTCFDDALDYISELVVAKGRAFEHWRYTVVHAACIAPRGARAGEQFAHAWVEEIIPSAGGPTVLTWEAGLLPGTGKKVYLAKPRDELLAELRPVKSTRYTIKQVMAENAKSGTFGPWLPEYIALCGTERVVYDDEEKTG